MKFQLSPLPSPFEWSPWFAWYPVATLDRQFVWLETVHRKWDDEGGTCIGDFSGHAFKTGAWEYVCALTTPPNPKD